MVSLSNHLRGDTPTRSARILRQAQDERNSGTPLMARPLSPVHGEPVEPFERAYPNPFRSPFDFAQDERKVLPCSCQPPPARGEPVEPYERAAGEAHPLTPFDFAQDERENWECSCGPPARSC